MKKSIRKRIRGVRYLLVIYKEAYGANELAWLKLSLIILSTPVILLMALLFGRSEQECIGEDNILQHNI